MALRYDAPVHVVTHRAWVARDLAAAGVARVVHSLGLDVPAGLGSGAVWAPMEWMARVRASGVDVPLADPGPAWLTTLPPEMLGRRVVVAALADVEDLAAPRGFFKPANVKVERLPATCGVREDFLAAAALAGLPDTSLVLHTPDMMRFVEEHRVWLRDGEPVTSSVYLTGAHGPGTGTTWSEQMTSTRSAQARAFAAQVCAAVETPRGLVVDVALVADGPAAGSWVVVEANPAWCSALYGADPAAVIDVLFACTDPAPAWRWRPDPWLAARARAQRPLTR